jgi:sugar lactone lactonase YvrE
MNRQPLNHQPQNRKRPRINPVSWLPPRLPRDARRPLMWLPPLTLIDLPGAGPEDVVVDEHGQVFTGLADGSMVRVDPAGSLVETIARTGGRPLGIELYRDGRLLVCDAERGLLLVDPADGGIQTLVARGEHQLRVCNNAAVASDGTVYFSDSTQRFDLTDWRADLLEHSGTGRLLRRDPDGAVTVLLDGLHFANGVALAPDESFVVVAQTGSYCLDRVWLTGDRAGTRDVFVANLPGFPDNVSTGTDGLFWIAMASPRDRILDILSRRHPVLRRLTWALPERLQPRPKRTVWARALDTSGAMVHDYYGPGEDFYLVTGVREHGGRLYLGSLLAGSMAMLELAAPPAIG